MSAQMRLVLGLAGGVDHHKQIVAEIGHHQVVKNAPGGIGELRVALAAGRDTNHVLRHQPLQRQGGIFDSTVMITGLVIIATPIFVLGFLAQFVFGVQLGIVPVTVGARATFARLLLPGIVLGSVSFAYVVRLTRSAVAANAHADYVRTATAKGLSRPRVVAVHILRNSLIPVVTFLGADLGSLMGGAIVTEGIFNIHGVGGVLYQAVTRQEAPTVVSIVTVLVLIYLISNLLVDLLYAALDPRIRYG